MNADSGTDHLEPQEVAAFIDGGPGPPDRERVVAHLADCSSCRAEVIAVRQNLSEERRVTLPSTWMVTAAAAAVAGIFFLGPILVQRTSDNGPALRGDDSALPSTIETLSPGDTVYSRSDLRFTWPSSGPDASYRITVTRVDGETIWTDQIRDTTAAPPSNMAFEEGTYFWFVDALTSNGRTLTSGMKRFVFVE